MAGRLLLMSAFFGPLLVGGSMMLAASKIDEYEVKSGVPRKYFFGSCLFSIGYGICWAGPCNLVGTCFSLGRTMTFLKMK